MKAITFECFFYYVRLLSSNFKLYFDPFTVQHDLD